MFAQRPGLSCTAIRFMVLREHQHASPSEDKRQEKLIGIICCCCNIHSFSANVVFQLYCHVTILGKLYESPSCSYNFFYFIVLG